MENWNPTILIVDDDQASLSILKNLLADLEAEVICVESGEDALTLLGHRDVSVALVDVQMPTIDGFELATQMRANPLTNDIPLVFVTAVKTSSEDIIKGYEFGAVDYIFKPVSDVVLKGKMRFLLSGALDHHLLQVEIDQRKEAEALLRKSEEHYRQIVEDQTELICRYKPDTTVLFANQAFCRYFGQRNENLIGTKYMPMMPEGERESISAFWSSFTPEQSVSSGEFEVILENGDSRWMHWTSRATFDDLGMVVEFQGTGRDITNQKLSELKVQKSEQRYRSLIENLPFCVHEIDLDGRLISMNPAGLQMMHVEQESTMCGLPYLDTVSEQDRDRVAELLEQALRGETHFFEFETDDPEEPRNFSTCFIPLFDEDRAVYRIMGLTMDITSDRRREVALREREASYRLLADNVRDIIWTMNLKFEYTYVSPSIFTTSGFTPEEVMTLGAKAV